ncbi:glycosyltransferase [Citricoccus muralis]|uniref:D-inositol 3-phosphate glycosyltransferase n=1 Tax=Citricoccus muralis TaxID=169134 RepID=A0ABY8HAW9_9MICC|nr:glycosyltransferase [Citricoccus muralis]WFP17757.1 glycosyltransferase [Citricoccus muralis]
MLQLFRRFSRKQKLVLGFFVIMAVLATVMSFFLDDTVLIILLFWLLALIVFIMIMFLRRLNAKIVRLSRGEKISSKKKRSEPKSRLTSAEPLQVLQQRFQRRKDASTALPLAKRLFSDEGQIREANEVLRALTPDVELSEVESRFVQRVGSFAKYLEAEYRLPQRHRTYNYVSIRDKVMYAVGFSPVSTSNGYTSRTQGIAKGLMDAGADVVVAPMPGKPWDKGPQPGYRVPKEEARYTRNVDGVRYVHNPGLKAWEGDLDVFIQATADAYVREAMIEKPEFIIAGSNYLSALPALIAARRLGVPFVYEIRGFWEVTAASLRPGWDQTDQYEFDRKFEYLVASQADKIVVITEEMRQDLIGRGLDGQKISVAPNCVDVNKFIPTGKDAVLLKRMGFARPDLPMVGFAGSVTEYEGLELVAQALADLRGEGYDFNFLVMGAGKGLPDLEKKVSSSGLDAVTRFVSGVPNDEMPVYLSSIDIFPLARKSLPVTELVSPLKPLEAMATGGAVVLSDVSPHGVFHGDESSRALSFRKDDVSSLKNQLRTLLDSPDASKLMGYRARAWVKANRQWSHSGRVFWDVVESLREGISKTDIQAEPDLKDYTVAFIGDTFTSDTFLPELTAVRVTPEDWRNQYSDQPFEVLFIESAWQGNDQAWEGSIGYYGDEAHAPIVELIDFCRSKDVPVMFWNKEDPVHFNRFKKTAALCDYVFTTDARTIPAYNAQPDNHIKTVASAPFAAQPRLHNPLPSERQNEDSIAYGGTYYGDKYATRKQGLDFLFYESVPYGLAIYERVHNDPNSPYRLPERFKRYARPSLSYPDMCQAYKAHPIHLNGNSVVDSPSMFSRRVVEITASGSSVLSSPGRGVDETFAGTVPTVGTPDEASAVLARWKGSEELRHRELWRGMRHVYETHTCAHRLVYMMRVAGFLVRSPQPPKFAVECASADLPAFRNQTFAPDVYLLTDNENAESVDVPTLPVSTPDLYERLKARGIFHIVQARSNVGTLGQHDLEDLVTALTFGDWHAVGKRVVTWEANDSFVPVAALSTDINDQVVLYDLDTHAQRSQSNDPGLKGGSVFAWQVVKDTKVASDRQAQSIYLPPAKKTVLLAGHDFKFFHEISAAISNADHEILVDQWSGHDIHNEDESVELLARADVIFCEWSLGNVAWYSRNKKPGQKLITRFHAQELRTRYLRDADISKVDTFVFVSPTGMARARVLYGIPASKCVVVGNTFDFTKFDQERENINPWNLGLVGSVPRSKRLDLALDIVEGLIASDLQYRLYVKGKQYTDFEWLLNREPEKAYFESQYARLDRSPALKDSVIFEGHSSDIGAWYRSRPGFILSTSDHEGTHQAIAEGGAAGCIPIVLPWAGAEAVYGDRWIVESPIEAVERIRRFTNDPRMFTEESNLARRYMREHFAPEVITQRLLKIIES